MSPNHMATAWCQEKEWTLPCGEADSWGCPREGSQELLTKGPGRSHKHTGPCTHTHTHTTCMHRHRHACENIHIYLQVSYTPHSNSPPTHKTFMDTPTGYTHQLAPCDMDT